MCGVKFLRSYPPGTETTTEEDVVSINCREIYNHERLPVNANVLVRQTSRDASSTTEQTSGSFRKATIVESFEKKSRSKQASYAYKVQFLDNNREYQRVNHEQVRSIFSSIFDEKMLLRLSRQHIIAQ